MAEAGRAEPFPAFTETPQLPVSHQFSTISEEGEGGEGSRQDDGSWSFPLGEVQVL